MSAPGFARPLLVRRLVTAPRVRGVIKERPEDFLVDELPLIEPSGQGEHLHMGIQKSGLTHDEMVRVLARHCGVREGAIGHAGMKDRQAVTRQTVSVHLPGLPDPPVLEHPSMQVLWTRRHDGKLRPGQLRGNRFSIRVRQTDPLAAPRVLQAMRQLERMGAPNAYGVQRFGHRRNSHVLGALLAEERWEDLLQELAGVSGSPFPDSQREARERFAAGDYVASAPLWARGDFAERAVTRALAEGRSARAAVMSVRGPTRSFWLNAVQSAVFNAVLSARMERGLFDRFIPGDVANLHPGRSLFRVTGAMLARPEECQALALRVAAFECSPTGPMIGATGMPSEEDAAELERRVAAATGVDVERFVASMAAPEGERRSLRMRVSSAEVESGVDQHGAFVRLAFDLPRGGYATEVLAEIFETPPASEN
jgi:tRNA pseudouridine13 synthase